MKLKTKDNFKFGQKNIVKYLGLIEISNEGIIEISEDNEKLALLLVDVPNSGFSIFEEGEESEDLKKKSEENDLGDKSEGEGIKPQTEDDKLNKIEVGSLESTSIKNDIIGDIVEDVQIDKTESIFTDEEKNVLIDMLNDKTYHELRDFATQNNYPESEWTQKVNGVQMVKYLTEKIKSL